MRKLHVLLFTTLLLAGVLAGCGEDTENEETENNEAESEQTEQPESEAEEFPVTIEGSDGEQVTIEEAPEAIVSLIPSNTEIAFALGLGDRIVGVSDYDNYPEETLEIDKIGGLELNLELILSLEPDLILAHPGNTPEGIDQLRESGLNVLMVNDAADFDGVYESIEMIAEATGTREEAEEIIAAMQDTFSKLEEKAAEIAEEEVKSIYIEISPEPEIYSPGNHTFENQILTMINAENIAADQDGWVELSEETIVDQNPDVIILTYDYIEDPVGQLMDRDAWQEIAAVQHEQVIQVDTDLISRPGPRLAEGADTLAKFIYPEVFED
ncbi:ABC transporter substrate-binding protein [Virgibacillus kimchii]